MEEARARKGLEKDRDELAEQVMSLKSKLAELRASRDEERCARSVLDKSNRMLTEKLMTDASLRVHADHGWLQAAHQHAEHTEHEEARALREAWRSEERVREQEKKSEHRHIEQLVQLRASLQEESNLAVQAMSHAQDVDRISAEDTVLMRHLRSELADFSTSLELERREHAELVAHSERRSEAEQAGREQAERRLRTVATELSQLRHEQQARLQASSAGGSAELAVDVDPVVPPEDDARQRCRTVAAEALAAAQRVGAELRSFRGEAARPRRGKDEHQDRGTLEATTVERAPRRREREWRDAELRDAREEACCMLRPPTTTTTTSSTVHFEPPEQQQGGGYSCRPSPASASTRATTTERSASRGCSSSRECRRSGTRSRRELAPQGFHERELELRPSYTSLERRLPASWRMNSTMSSQASSRAASRTPSPRMRCENNKTRQHRKKKDRELDVQKQALLMQTHTIATAVSDCPLRKASYSPEIQKLWRRVEQANDVALDDTGVPSSEGTRTPKSTTDDSWPS